MKIPFSYRHSFFVPVLSVTVLAHGTFFLQRGLFSSTPQFSVERAPSSMAVVILKDSNPEPRVQKEEAPVVTVKEVSAQVKVVAPKKVSPKPRKIPAEKSVPIASNHGALSEAKPHYLQNPAPIYPDFARERGWQGVVTLQVAVNENGLAGHVSVFQSSGFKLLDRAAVNAVRRWIFSPAHMGTLKLKSDVKIPIRFVLND